jgi:hypothetical protein
MAITIRFVGICTHITARNNNTHRVVLVRADNGAHLKDAAIPPHIPKLIIDPADVVCIDGYPHGLEPMGPAGQWRIHGVSFTVSGVKGDPIARHDSFKDVPRLETESGSRPGPSAEVIDAEQAACYFDLDKGMIHASQAPTEAWETEAIVETDPEPALRVTCFWNRSVSHIRLRQGATVVLEHTGYLHSESDQDYLLHYRVLQSVPNDAKMPPGKKRAVTALPGDISIACSNSQYP